VAERQEGPRGRQPAQLEPCFAGRALHGYTVCDALVIQGSLLIVWVRDKQIDPRCLMAVAGQVACKSTSGKLAYHGVWGNHFREDLAAAKVVLTCH
jgi:hypothetical protein